MALTDSAISQGETHGNGCHVGVTGTVIAIAELMVRLDATVLGIALADREAGLDGVTDRVDAYRCAAQR